MATVPTRRPGPPRKSAKGESGHGNEKPRKKVEKTRKTLPKAGKPTHSDILLVLAKLTPLDKELLKWLYTYRYALTHQIHRRFFAEERRDDKITLQDCRRRLWELGREGVIAGLTYATRQRAWVLDKRGLVAAQGLLGIPQDRQLSMDDWSTSSMQLDHYVLITEVACQLHGSGLQHRWHSRTRLVWKAESETTSSNVPTNKVSFEYLHPDAIIMLQGSYDIGGNWQSEGWTPVYLEVDRNTEEDGQIRSKLDRYNGAFYSVHSQMFWDHREKLGIESAPWGGRDHQNKFIFFVCDDRLRADEIQMLIDEYDLPGLAIYKEDDISGTLQGVRDSVAERREELKRQEDERRRQAEENQRLLEQEQVRREQQAAWEAFDQQEREYRAQEDAYVAQNKSWLRGEQKCRTEFQAVNPRPVPPAFPRPDADAGQAVSGNG